MVSEEKQGRDVTIGVFFTAAVGVVSLLEVLDWKNPFHLILMFFMGAVALASAALCLICWIKMHRSAHSPGCERVKAEIEEHFSPK